MTFNFLYLSFSTLHSSSFWRDDTIFFAKLNKPPVSSPHRPPAPPSSLHPSQMCLKPAVDLKEVKDLRYISDSFQITQKFGQLTNFKLFPFQCCRRIFAIWSMSKVEKILAGSFKIKP